MKIQQILTRRPACIAATATLVEAALHMKLLDVDMLLVCDGDRRVVGTLTDRDIAIRGVAQEADPRTATVRDIMTEDTVWCFDDQDVTEAAKLMETWQFRRLPVVNRQERLVGIVSQSDLAGLTGADKVAVEVAEQLSVPSALV